MDENNNTTNINENNNSKNINKHEEVSKAIENLTKLIDSIGGEQ